MLPQHVEMNSREVAITAAMENPPTKATEPSRSTGILQQNRDFLDFFWDIAKPDQDVRLKAVEGLIGYLKSNDEVDKFNYTIKRLVDGLAHTRETARPGFSLALGQVLFAFESITLQSVLDQIKVKHNLQTVKKKIVRNAMFGNLFGVLALHQSGRLFKEPLAVLGCVQLLQGLTKHRQHMKDLPNKTMMDILTEIPEDVFEEVLLSALQNDLASAFQTPEHLQLLLVALRHFPHTLSPKKLKKLLGSATIINTHNIPKLTEVLKMAALSVKKERILPVVAFDLLMLSLREDSFLLFWENAIIGGLLKEQQGPTSYLCLRLLGSALPLLSVEQLKVVLKGEVMMHYGQHVVSAQKPDRFKLAPEMDTFVSDFLQGCQETDKQLEVVVGFSSLTNRGYPVVPSAWRVVQHLQPAALQDFVVWLKDMFLHPRLDQLLNFSTQKQRDSLEEDEPVVNDVVRLRKWIVARLSSIIGNHQTKKTEDLVLDVARFLFFHAFFDTKKATSDIKETKERFSVPLDVQIRTVIINSFFGLLPYMHHMPIAEETATEATHQRQVQGVEANSAKWIFQLVQYAHLLLSQPEYVQCAQPFRPEQRQAWDSMLESVASLKKTKKGRQAEMNSLRQLFLLVGIHLFKAPEEMVDIVNDLRSCVDVALKKTEKKMKQATPQEDEPEWVEVMVDILLSLLSQPSRHIRQVCKLVFASICPHVNAAALSAILDVLDPDKDDEERAMVVTDDGDSNKTLKKNKLGKESDSDDDSHDDADDSDDHNDDDSDDTDEDMEEEESSGSNEEDEEMDDIENQEVDEKFRLQLMNVLQQENVQATEEDGSSDEDLDDDAMMELDKNLSALFSEQKKRMQAKKDVKKKLHKEKVLLRDFKIKVLDLVEVFVARQAGNPLVLHLLEPLLKVIDRGMSSESDQQEQDYLRRVADIFRNQLCRSKLYCRTAGDKHEELQQLLDKLMTRCQRLSDSSVCLYYFSACLYLVKVLRGVPPKVPSKDEHTAQGEVAEDFKFMGNVDVDRVSNIFSEALSSFLGRRKSPMSSQMFTDLLNRFPALCVKLLDTAVQHITSGFRDHQQGQACVLVLRALQKRETQQLHSAASWRELCVNITGKLTECLTLAGQTESKILREKVLKALELCHFLLKLIKQQELSIDLDSLQCVLQSLPSIITFKKTGKLEDTYWAVMKHFGVMKPQAQKTKSATHTKQQVMPKKKKGFLPETKKRQNHKKIQSLEQAETMKTAVKTAIEKGTNKQKNKKAKRKQMDSISQDSPVKKTKKSFDSRPAKMTKRLGKVK